MAEVSDAALEPSRPRARRTDVTHRYLMPDDVEEAPGPLTIERPRTLGYPIDNRDAVIGPLPKAAPPVLGDWAATDPQS